MSNIYDRDYGYEGYDSIAVIGVGGGGSWVALLQALNRVEKIIIIDPDRVEESNLNRTPYRLTDIGKLKVEAMKEMILERRPDCNVITIADTFNQAMEKNLMDILSVDIIFDCTDNLHTREYMRQL